MILLYAFLITSLCALLVVIFRIKRSRFFRLMNKLPGPKRCPILGNFPDLVCEDEEFFKRMREWAKLFGPVYNISCSYFPTVNITDAEEFELVASTTKNMRKALIYGMLHRWLGRGLLTSAGRKWKTNRKIVNSAFSFSILQDFIPVFHRETDKMVELLKKYDGREVNLVHITSQYGLCCIAETAMGIALDPKNDNDLEYINSLFKLGKIFFLRLLRPWLYSETIFYNFSSIGRVEKKLINIIHDFNNKIVQKRAEQYALIKQTEYVNNPDKKKLTLVDLLLEEKFTSGKMNDKAIQDEVSTFLFAGQDTTSICISFTLMLLASHKEIQDQVYQEMYQLFGESLHQLTLKELNELKYMEMVLKESLRLYPSAPFIARVLDDDLMTRQGYLLPKGAIVNIHIFDIHRNPKYWPEPDKFDPERFLPENCAKRHPYSFVPFSAGPRNCLGQKFAFLEMKACLYGILRNFIVVPVDTPETIVLVPNMVLRTKGEKILVRFLPRN